MRYSILLASSVLLGCGGGVARWDPAANVPASAQHLEIADANDAAALYAVGVSLLESEPQKAADAFYWASRLDPTWADPLYARRLALLLVNPYGFRQYYIEPRRSFYESPAVQRLDSLYFRALRLNPFLQPRLHVAAYRRVLAQMIETELRARDPTLRPEPGQIEHEIRLAWLRAPPATRAVVAFSEGRFVDAVTAYERAIEALDRDDEERSSLEADLGRVLFRLARYDEAKQRFRDAIAGWRERDERELVRIYESKALHEHATGLIEEAQENMTAAREAYARALQEDLAYFPAHIRLGEVALALGDTTTAIAELALAAEIAADDAGTRYQYGRLLAAANRVDEAERELRHATTLEPLFAEPYLALARLLERQPGRTADAAQAYSEFLDRASRSHRERAAAEARMRALRAGAGGERP